MEYIKEIQLDVSCRAPAPIINGKQLDNGTRTIKATFVNTETSTNISFAGTETFELRVRRPDGVLIVSDDVTLTNNKVNVTLSDNMLAVPGRARADIRAKDGDDVLTGGSFFIDVQPLAEGDSSSGISGDVTNTRMLTRAQFNELPETEANTLYFVNESTYPDEGVYSVYLGSVRIVTGGVNRDIDMESLFMYRNIAAGLLAYSRLAVDDNGNITLTREKYQQYSANQVDKIEIYDEDAEGIIKISARNQIILTLENGDTLDFNQNGAFINGKSIVTEEVE